MAKTTTTAGISRLLPIEREVYEVHRLPQLGADSRAPAYGACVSCGAPVTPRGSGARTPLSFKARDRGTSWQNAEEGFIHRGCVPRPTGELPRIRARALRSPQVTA